MSPSAIARRLGKGRSWQLILPGVYLAVTGTPTPDQRDMAALLYAGRDSMLTGVAALRWYSVRAVRSDSIDLLVPASRRRQSTQFVVLRPTYRLPEFVCYRGQVLWALAPRAVADAARSLQNLSQVRAVVAQAVQKRICTVEQLVAELQAGPVQGSARLRAVLGEVAAGVRSVPEADVMGLIMRGGLAGALFNPKLYVGADLLAIPDVWWPAAGVAVEVDSKEWHLSPERWEATMARHARMTALGILVLHFSPRQIREQPEEVLGTIRAALASRRGSFSTPIRTVSAAA